LSYGEDTMKLTTICLLLGFTYLASAASTEKYRGYETPSYTVVEKNLDYELRSYPACKVIRTKMEAAKYEDVENTMFRRLFDYLSKSNDRAIQIEMTTPVATAFETRRCAACPNNYQMNFILPSDVTNPPTPLSTDVEIVDQPAFEVYVRRFESVFFFDEKWINQGVELYKSLARDEIKDENLELSSFYAVGYDGPEVWFGRRNEVWIIKK